MHIEISKLADGAVLCDFIPQKCHTSNLIMMFIFADIDLCMERDEIYNCGFITPRIKM